MARNAQKILDDLEKVIFKFEDNYLSRLKKICKKKVIFSRKKNSEIDLRIEIGSFLIANKYIFGDLEPSFDSFSYINPEMKKRHDELVERMEFFISVYQEFERDNILYRSLINMPDCPLYPKDYIGFEGPGIKFISIQNLSSQINFSY